MKKITGKYYLHMGFWLFMLLFIFDYHWSDDIGLLSAIGYSSIEVIGYTVVFYLNLYFLKKKQVSNWLYAGLFSAFVILFYMMFVRLSDLEYLLYEGEGTRNLFSLWLNASLFTTLAWLVAFAESHFKTQQKNMALETANKQLQIDVLKSRINPHFLFNTLNNLNALIIKKDKSIHTFVSKLSGVLRYSFDAGSQKTISLEKEINYLQDYLELVKMQKPASENIDFYVEGKIESYYMIPYILTSLLENAIKHGDIQHNENGFLHIFIEVADKFLFEISNSVTQGEHTLENEDEKRKHLGLANIQKQLSLHYGQDFKLQEISNESTYKISLEIALNKMTKL